MLDENQNAAFDADLLANQEVPVEETPSSETPAEQPIAKEPEPEPLPPWKAKYNSPDDMWEEHRKFMSKADRLEAENQKLRQQIPQFQQPQVDPVVLKEKRLEQFVQDPDAVINEAAMKLMGPLAAKVILSEYLTEHPEAKPYRNAMKDVLDREPGILTLPNGLHALYLLAKDEDVSGKATEAQGKVAEHRAAVQESKKTDAYVEPATQPKRSAPPTLKEGMSIEESVKALDAMGIGELKEY